MDWNDFDGVLFDLDGVLTPTAEVHMRAWQQLFIDFLTKRGITQPYVESDYFDYIDGKPRYDGVRAMLASRSITLAEGDPSDSPETETVCGLGNRKNVFFSTVLAEDGVQPYPGSVRLLDFLAERDIKVAVVSSSRNAPPVLEAPGSPSGSRLSSTGTWPPSTNCPANPHRTPSCTPPSSWGSRSSAPWSSRTPCPACKRGGPAASAWSRGGSGSRGRSVDRGRGGPGGADLAELADS